MRNGVVFIALNVVQLTVGINVQLNAASYGVTPRGRPHRRTVDCEVAVLELPRLAKVVFKFHSSSLTRCFSLFTRCLYYLKRGEHALFWLLGGWVFSVGAAEYILWVLLGEFTGAQRTQPCIW